MCCMATKWQQRRSQLSFQPPADDNSNQPRSCRYTHACTSILPLLMMRMQSLSLGIWSRRHSIWICSLATLNSATSCLWGWMFRSWFSACVEDEERTQEKKRFGSTRGLLAEIGPLLKLSCVVPACSRVGTTHTHTLTRTHISLEQGLLQNCIDLCL